MTIRHALAALTLTLAAGLPATVEAQAGDLVFANGFDPVMPTEAEAARFLNRATFGATPADIQAVRNLGYEAWLEQQFAAPRTVHRRPLEELALTALRHFVWNPTVTMTPGRRARWACVQAAGRPVHMSTRRV